MGIVRVVEVAAVRHPETGQYVVPNPTAAYRDDDPIVLAYPWMFKSDNDAERPAEQPIERAVANPGYRRPTRRDR